MANERLNAENAVAGALLIDPRAFDLVADKLSAEDFQSELCRSVYQAAQGLSQKGSPSTRWPLENTSGNPADKSATTPSWS